MLVMGSAAVAIAGTALGLFLMGIPANLLTLAGLGMGIGILVTERRGGGGTAAAGAGHGGGPGRGGSGIFPAVLGSTVTTGVVLLPFLYLQGNARAAFVPFAVAVHPGPQLVHRFRDHHDSGAGRRPRDAVRPLAPAHPAGTPTA
jgi:hypothetical protein